MTEPRDLTNLVPNDARAELAVAVAALEQHGPAVTEALRQLDQATTAAWQALNSVEPTDEWRLVRRATGIDRGWDATYQLVPRSIHLDRSLVGVTPDGPAALFRVATRMPWKVERPGRLTTPRPGRLPGRR